MGAKDEPLDGRGDSGRVEGCGEAGGAVGGCAGGRLAGDGSPHHAVLQGGGGAAVAARGAHALPQRARCPCQCAAKMAALPVSAAKMAAFHTAATSAAAPAAAHVDARSRNGVIVSVSRSF